MFEVGNLMTFEPARRAIRFCALQLHSGLIGDYAAWLAVGVAAIAVVLAIA